MAPLILLDQMLNLLAFISKLTDYRGIIYYSQRRNEWLR